MVDFVGSSGNDFFSGTDLADTASGNGGDDTLNGNGGSDRLEGGAGADTIDGGSGVNFLVSYIADANFYTYPYATSISLDIYADRDILIGGADDDYIAAGYGDTISGGGGYNKLYINFLGATSGVIADFTLQSAGGSITIGGATISGITQTVNVQGSNFDDTIKSVGGPSGSSRLYGNGGNDTIIADYYNAYVSGGDGNDFIDARLSFYTGQVDGDAGDDIIYVSTNGAPQANGGDGNDTIYAGGNAYGGNGNDTIRLTSSSYASDANGDSGDDKLYASLTGSVLYGGAGADMLYGDMGADTLVSGDRSATNFQPTHDVGLEHDILSAGAGDDVLWIGYGDDADGGAGVDSLNLSFGGAASSVSFDSTTLVTGGSVAVGGGVITSIEKLVSILGSGFSDFFNIATQTVSVSVDGGAGDDVLVSNGSSVVFMGGAGNDTLRSGSAGDGFYGGDGIDTIDYQTYAVGGSISLALVAGQAGIGLGGDQLFDVENVNGTRFNDTINGNAAANFLNGYGGDDIINGNAGDDTIVGGDGADQLNGDDGNDRLDGGAGADILHGGNGNDILDGDYGDATALSIDQLFGDAGDDAITIGAGDSADGGTGTDSLSISLGNSALGTTIDLRNLWTGGTGTVGTGTVTNFERLDFILGSNGNDVITLGTSGTVVAGLSPPPVVGLGGDDQLTGGGDRDLLSGGDGNDILIGLGGDDQLIGGDGNDRLEGGSGDDTLVGGLGVDILIGGVGSDTYNYSDGHVPADDQILENAGDAGLDTLRITANVGPVVDTVFANVRNVENAELVTLTDVAGFEFTLGAQFQAAGFRSVTASADIDARLTTSGQAFVISPPNIRDITVLAGSGNDVFTLAANAISPFSQTFTLNGGAGSDTLVLDRSMTLAETYSGGAGGHIFLTGIETIRVTAGRDAQAVVGGPDVAGTVNNYVITLTDAMVNSVDRLTLDLRALRKDVVVGLGADGELGGTGVNADTFASDTVSIVSLLTGTRGITILGGATDDAFGNYSLGNDIFYGGAGNDIISYSGPRSRVSMLRLANGRYEVRSPNGEVDTLVGIERIRIDIQIYDTLSGARQDLNNDRDSDLIVWSQSTGLVSRYDSVNGQISGSAVIGDAGSGSWDVRASGDFYGDGSTDLVLKNQTTGQFGIWIVSNGVRSSITDLGVIGTNWDVRFSGDFNRDGNSDILWRNANDGHLYIWNFNGAAQQSGGASLGVIGTNWDAAGVGDFDGDGDSDVLLRNKDNGRLYIYGIQNDAIAQYKDVGTFGANWVVAGVGDFNADGISDVVIKDSLTGQFKLLNMNSAMNYTEYDFGIIGRDWTIAATGDYNADGTDDLIWRNTATGQVYLWTMENGQQLAAGSGNIGTFTADQIIA
jgi:Ca2+-binding RTX toxin-like protein